MKKEEKIENRIVIIEKGVDTENKDINARGCCVGSFMPFAG
jgi:hypothetical protein